MNMFKSRRRAKEQSDTLEAFNVGPTTPTTYRTIKGLKRKNKPIPEDLAPAFNLASALPDDRDFRTSLLMPNLAARFSMLREQDDPNTKIGKASDDSVLFPKRASRMNLFGHNGLADVAEVEPFPSTFRPPFAERTNSVGDGYDSDGGSVMSRSRPGEGNGLFGGRQKLYRMGTNSTRNLNESNGLGDRYVYGGDVSSPHLAQPKSTEAVVTEDNRTSVPCTDTGDSSDIASPATAFSKDRGTQSSTNSAPRRSSTAATSVASESPALRNSNATSESVSRSGDHAVPTSENLASLQVSKTRDDTMPHRFAIPKTNLDRSHRPLGIYSSTSFRNASSPVKSPIAQPLDFGFSDEIRSASATGRYRTDSPTPNPIPETDIILANNLQPSDRGKATALGLFNKPAKEFDEHQFNQRQKQMYDDNVSPMVSNSRSTSRASGSVVRSPSPTPDFRTSTPQMPPIPSATASPVIPNNRISKASGRSTPPRPRSKSATSITAVNHTKARVESLIKKQNSELTVLDAKKIGTSDLKQEDPSEDKENYSAAFFDNEDDDSELDDSNGLASSRGTSSRFDESNIHPAFRNSYQVSETYSRKSNHSNFSKTRSVLDDERHDTPRLQVPGRESEPTNGAGLSGLIRAHLRQHSGNSSIGPRPDSSIRPDSTMVHTAEPSRSGSIASTSQTAADSLRSDPFDLDANRNLTTPRISQARLTPTSAMSKVAQQFLSQAMAIKDAAEKEKSVESIDLENSPKDTTWREDLEPKHQRGESTETTKERREFDEELAARRRKIREGLKSVTERDRSQSPATATRGQVTTMQAFVQQRAVTDPQPKTMKMMGLQPRDIQSGPFDEERGRDMSFGTESRRHIVGNAFQKRQTPMYAQFPTDSNTERHYPPRSATPPASRNAMRDRSKSRTRLREVNPPLPMPRTPFANVDPSTPSPTEESQNDFDPIMRLPGHRIVKSPPAELVLRYPTLPSARPSPISPSSSYDSPLDSTRSPGPYVSGRTTPSSGRTTPSTTNRKRSVNKTMISEPTFVSSTSSVPLVHLPNAQSHGQSLPPVPSMSRRRRGNTINDKPVPNLVGLGFSRSPLETVPASPVVVDFGTEVTGRKNSLSPRKLRKSNSEGGSMAARARQQAMAAELAQEKARSPTLPTFPNKSATALGMSSDGAMF